MRHSVFIASLFSVAVMAAEVRVTVAPLSELAIHPERSAPATVESLNNADLSAQITARVDAIPVRVGDRVKAGDLLVRLDCREHESRLAAERANLSQLESQRNLALSQLSRATDLKRDRNISEEEVDRRRTELAAADAQIAAQREAVLQAELNAERCTVRAPFPAVVTARLTDVGSLADPGTALLRVVQLDPLEVSARVRPDEVAEGTEAGTLELDYLGRRYPLVVRRILPVVDPETRTVEVRLEFSAEAAPPGASGRLVWRSQGDYLPPELPVRRRGVLGVFVLDNGRAVFHLLPGALEGQPARVDLPGDSLVILEGRQRLQDGDPARVAETGR